MFVCQLPEPIAHHRVVNGGRVPAKRCIKYKQKKKKGKEENSTKLKHHKKC